VANSVTYTLSVLRDECGEEWGVDSGQGLAGKQSDPQTIRVRVGRALGPPEWDYLRYWIMKVWRERRKSVESICDMTFGLRQHEVRMF
jgi:hypothetical protein